MKINDVTFNNIEQLNDKVRKINKEEGLKLTNTKRGQSSMDSASDKKREKADRASALDKSG